MAQVPLYQQQDITTGPSAASTAALSAAVNAPSPYSSMFASINKDAFNYIDQQAADQGKAAGAKDQQAAGPSSLVTPGDTFSSYGKAYAEGANAVFTASKAFDLSQQIAPLRAQYHDDPQGLQQALAPLQKQWLSNVPGEMLPTMTAHSDTVIGDAITQATNNQYQFQKQEAQAAAVTSADNMRATVHDQIVSGADPADIQSTISNFTTFSQGLAKTGVSPAAIRKLSDNFGMTVREAEVIHDFRAQPGLNAQKNWLDSFSNAKDDETSMDGIQLDPEHRQALQNELHGEYSQKLADYKTGLAEQKSDIAVKFSDEIAGRELTGQTPSLVTPAQIRLAYQDKPDQANLLIQKLNTATGLYNANQALKTTTYADDTKFLSTPPSTDDSVGLANAAIKYNQISAAIRKKWSDIGTDPAGYIESTSPVISAVAKSTDAGSGQKYVDMQADLQTQLGIPDFKQKPLPNSVVLSTVAQIHDAGIQDPAQVPAQMTQLSQKYGTAWPKVLAQLVTDGKLNPAYQSLGLAVRPEDGYWSKALANGLSTGESKLDEAVGASGSKAIKDQLSTGLQEFNNTASAAGADAGLVDSVNHAARIIAYQYSLSGMDPTTAATRAVSDLLDSRYDFAGTYRVPKGYLPAAENATEAATAAITPESLAPINPVPNDNLTQTQRQQIGATNAKRGIWVTTPHDDGLTLLYPDKSPVVRADGTRIILKFRGMNKNAVAPATPDYLGMMNGG